MADRDPKNLWNKNDRRLKSQTIPTSHLNENFFQINFIFKKNYKKCFGN